MRQNDDCMRFTQKEARAQTRARRFCESSEVSVVIRREEERWREEFTYDMVRVYGKRHLYSKKKRGAGRVEARRRKLGTRRVGTSEEGD